MLTHSAGCGSLQIRSGFELLGNDWCRDSTLARTIHLSFAYPGVLALGIHSYPAKFTEVTQES
jgi:hypothetical protein